MKTYIAGKRVVRAQGKEIRTKKMGSRRGHLQDEERLEGGERLNQGISGGRGLLVEEYEGGRLEQNGARKRECGSVGTGSSLGGRGVRAVVMTSPRGADPAFRGLRV